MGMAAPMKPILTKTRAKGEGANMSDFENQIIERLKHLEKRHEKHDRPDAWRVIDRFVLAIGVLVVGYSATEMRDLRIEVTELQTRVTRNEAEGTPGVVRQLTKLQVTSEVILSQMRDMRERLASLEQKVK